VDILLRGARIAVFVDGCFWHSCPEHCQLPKTNTRWWRLKFRGIVRRDRDTDAQLASAGWLAVRVWEHEDPVEAARKIEQFVRGRTTTIGNRARTDTGVRGWDRITRWR
jgi:DNA mismatch endonuclease (patch repair protein)